jgi:hypothetical protein
VITTPHFLNRSLTCFLTLSRMLPCPFMPG